MKLLSQNVSFGFGILLSRSLILSFSRSLVLSFSRSLVLSFSRSLFVLHSFSLSLSLSLSLSVTLPFPVSPPLIFFQRFLSFCFQRWSVTKLRIYSKSYYCKSKLATKTEDCNPSVSRLCWHSQNILRNF